MKKQKKNAAWARFVALVYTLSFKGLRSTRDNSSKKAGT
jgi:hypothetical protein